MTIIEQRTMEIICANLPRIASNTNRIASELKRIADALSENGHTANKIDEVAFQIERMNMKEDTNDNT